MEIVPPQEDGVRSFYGFSRWPQGVAQLDLGGRIIDVLPAPGHNDNHVVFYDRDTDTLLTGDFLLPGRVTVADTGPGMSEEERRSATRPFVRGAESPGAGLGLAIVSALCERFDWTLRLDGAPGQGTTAEIRFAR